MSIRLEVWGDYACFTRPEMKVERVSYDVITPSAARGILEAIYWHPGIKYVIDRINVLAPIVYSNIRRNEVKSKLSVRNAKSMMDGQCTSLYLDTSADRTQRAAMVLRNVHYVIEAHFELVPDKMGKEDNVGKFSDIIRRRIEKGQCYHQPYFGCREFPTSFRAWTEQNIPTVYQNETRDLGFMLYDLDYSNSKNIQPLYYRATMKDGVIDLRGVEVMR